jgi:hypothetical protein
MDQCVLQVLPRRAYIHITIQGVRGGYGIGLRVRDEGLGDRA